MVAKGHKKAVWITWKYAAGDEAFEGFKESYTKAGGTIVKELGLPFPQVEFQALLTEIAALKPDAVACFFAGGGAAKFIKRLRGRRPQGQDPAVWLGLPDRGRAGRRRPGRRRHHHHHALQRLAGHAAQQAVPPGIRQDEFRMQPDVYAVQGYDTGLLLAQGAKPPSRATLNGQQAGAVQGARIGHHRQPARQVDHEQVAQPGAGHLPARAWKTKRTRCIGIAAKALSDSGAGCKMA